MQHSLQSPVLLSKSDSVFSTPMSKFSEIFRKHINNGMTLRKKRFKHRKCMRQFFVFRKINNLMLFLCSCQRLLKTDRVISQMIVMACHQPCRCKRIKQLRIFRIYISLKWCFLYCFPYRYFGRNRPILSNFAV